MAVSQQKTVVAVVRAITGLSVESFAEMIEKSVATVRSLESGRLKLSPNLAHKIMTETGVSLEWLLEDDPTAPPRGRWDFLSPQDFHRDYFEEWRGKRAAIEQREELLMSQSEEDFLMPPQIRLNAIIESVRGGKHHTKAMWRITSFLTELEREFGSSDAAKIQEAERWAHLVKFTTLFTSPAARSTANPTPSWRHYQELVPSFLKELEEQSKEEQKRLEKTKPGVWERGFQRVKILPLLEWVQKAFVLWSPSTPHPDIADFVEKSQRERKEAHETYIKAQRALEAEKEKEERKIVNPFINDEEQSGE